MSFLLGLLDGVTESIEERKKQKIKQAETEAEAARERGKELLRGIISGDIEQTERPEEAIITEPGQAIKRGLFGLGKPTQTTPTRYYKRGKGKIGETKPQDILSLIAGLTSPEKIFGEEVTKKTAPLSLGEIAEGGEVLETPGYPGEYAPGYEPKPQPKAIGGLLGQKLGITPQEATRKYFGLPQKRGTFTQAKIEQVKGALEAGKVFSGDMFYPLRTEKQKEEYAQSQLGPNWRQHIKTTPKVTETSSEVSVMDTNW